MEKVKRGKYQPEGSKTKKLTQEEKKFDLVSCPINESYCHNILNEINDLYAKSELARVDKEYLKSVYLLEEAYNKTNELNQERCKACTDLFKYHINKTFNGMKEELYDISHGVFSSKSYQLAYSILCEKTD